MLYEVITPHVELQRADDADDPVRADARLEHRRRALFRELLQRAAEVLRLERVLGADP